MEFITQYQLYFLCLSLQADFPANTNILYVDLPSAELVGSSNDKNSLPGMVLNTKKSIVYVDQFGRKQRYVSFPLICQCNLICLCKLIELATMKESKFSHKLFTKRTFLDTQ